MAHSRGRFRPLPRMLANTIYKTFGGEASHALKISMESTHIAPSNAVGAALASDQSLVQLPSRRTGSVLNVAVDTFGLGRGACVQNS